MSSQLESLCSQFEYATPQSGYGDTVTIEIV